MGLTRPNRLAEGAALCGCPLVRIGASRRYDGTVPYRELYDEAVTALVNDLCDRGRQDDVLVMTMGEFGRTPRINKNAGRDHWGPAFTVALGGGGIRGGRVVGKSDARAEKPASDPYGPEDLAATIYHLLGIDPREEFHTAEGRPVPIVQGGRVIRVGRCGLEGDDAHPAVSTAPRTQSGAKGPS